MQKDKNVREERYSKPLETRVSASVDTEGATEGRTEV